MEKSERALFHSNIIYTFIFGVLWGLLEIFASELLVPNNIFIKGLIFSFIAVFILMISKKVVDYKCSLIIVSLIALVLIFAARSFSVNILIAILSEALIAEIIFFGPIWKKFAAMAVGALVFLYSFIHGLIFHGSLPGSYLVYQHKNMLYDLTGISVSKDAYFLVLIFFGFISLIIGIIVGWLSFMIINIAAKKMGVFIENFIISE